MEQALIVRRWRRYGADRLYVTAETGAPLGSVDLATGAVAVEPDAAVEGSGVEEAVRGAAQAYLRADVPELVLPASAVLPPEEPEPLPVAQERPRGRRARPAESDEMLHAAGSDAGRAEPRGRHRAVDSLVSPREDGEPRGMAESLCDRLDRLVLAGWHVLHDVPVGRQGTVVGHLLVGPPGAFAVAERPAAAAPQRFAVDGRSLSADGVALSDLRDLRLTAARAGSLLRTAVGSPVAVRGVLVVHGEIEVLRPSPYEAMVVADEQAPDVFTAMPGHWTPGRVDAVAAIARRRSTWALTWAV
ncbi:NERD domain-containing protein [Cellulomonas triticagri]|uniref:NERD domain-containing protein n=1 Tax=Cellulomonas triticagri TaxID=2483352 RepID=A0A3M2JKU3_9CELL|nr:NERD domain-containing protein [Cellulomonas triticagri]RMI12826.1 NERD domain-containing protein [Cellulomonas triticagri]